MKVSFGYNGGVNDNELKLCAYCNTPRRWLHDHHVKPRIEGGTDADGVDQICANCHEDEHGGPFGGVLRGRLGNSPEAIAKKSAKMREHWNDPAMRERWVEARRASGKLRSKRPERDELVKRYEAGATQDEIGHEFGVAQSAVSIWFQEYEIETSRGRRQTEPPLTEEQIMAALVENGSVSAAARALGVPGSTFRQWMSKRKVEWETLTEPGRETIEVALRKGGTVTKAAKLAVLPRSTFAWWMSRYGIEAPTLRPSRDVIEQAYVEAGFRLGKTAALLGVSYSTANRWITEDQIERRGKVGRPSAQPNGS